MKAKIEKLKYVPKIEGYYGFILSEVFEDNLILIQTKNKIVKLIIKND